ncbi:hypothetical protein BX661DRAFT_203262 [Kickxella alabastrina]|uniref:uncharacterized protein n=1 Tax=Kickxella alabastrina TaxID=61397 RepID=UPI00221EEDE3|nr:uncharacterized protein BX661DRAFT_203262 [Kickxella alabastrina]KAI7833599.1 hypothetical protein BX661DRAFT_203262 [Kickxella alabastrina]
MTGEQVVAYLQVLPLPTFVISPCPRYSPVSENCPALPVGQSLDTSDSGINRPLYSATLGGTALPLCWYTTPLATHSVMWTASKSVTIKFNSNPAIHSGANLPSSDKAMFVWTWDNALGNREFYINCTDVAVKGGLSSSYTGKQITVANYPGYPTIPEFSGDYETRMVYYDNAKHTTV